MLASASVSDILQRTYSAHMAPTSPPPSINRVTINGISRSNHVSHSSTSPSQPKPIILHLGAEICYNPDTYDCLNKQFQIIRPDPADLDRPAFIQHLKDRKWGNFSAIMKPFWATGSQMHPWNQELIDLLPSSVKVMAGAGAGFDWVDTAALAARGMPLPCSSFLSSP